MKLTKDQIKFLSNEKKKVAALVKEQEKIYQKCLKELKIKDGANFSDHLCDYLFIDDISVKELEKHLDKAIKTKDTGNCDADCGCKH